MSKNIIILGAGYGGISAAKKLAKIYKKNNEVNITLIDKNPYHTLLTEIHELAGKRIQEEAVKVNLDQLFTSTKVNLVTDNIEDIDLNNKKLNSNKNQYNYDYLIMGTGSQPSSCGVDGVQEHALNLWSIEDALKIRKKVEKSFQQARMTNDPEQRKKLLSFVVSGAGFTGIEMLGELIDWKNEYCQKYDIEENEVNLYSIEGLDDILPSLDAKATKRARKHLQKNGVQIITGNFVTELEENKLVLEDETIIEANTIIWACGVEASQFAQKSGLETSQAERIKVNKYLQTTEHPEVYAIGDNSAASWKDDQLLPALVEAAQQTGECAAENIAAEINGIEKKEFEPSFHGIMISIGSKYAVAEVMGMSIQGIPALFMKHMVNMYYRFEIGGIKEGYNFVSNYLKEQGSKKGGLLAQLFDHLSTSSRTIFIVLLRVFAGVMWLYEGYTKVRDGWLASGDYLVSGSTASPIGDYAVGWYVTITENIVFQFPLLFQYLVVFTMIGIGFSLVFGLFTSLGALASAGMSINFLLAGQYPHFSSDFPGHFSPLYWFLFASIALIGSGRAFGLDYYILPWLKSIIWKRPKGKDEDLKKVVENN